MALRVVGAGVGRTGTHSLKVALEQLLGGPCYHMVEVFAHPEHVAAWTAAMKGEAVDWDLVFDGFVATVDWPGAAVWSDIHAAHPDALVLLSTRDSADAWWKSASRTIFVGMGDRASPGNEEWYEMAVAMMQRFSPNWRDEDAAKAAYDAHNAHVRATVPPDRLVEWQPSDGWGPLCAALDVPVPDEPFPVTNTTADFRQMLGLEP
ncbi:MAG: sulfotransferase family protein [Actinobacteria bacterium]|nr:sulfotransferase family protein [Actinomycetota bacterium]